MNRNFEEYRKNSSMDTIGIRISNAKPNFCGTKWLGNPDMPVQMAYPCFEDVDGGIYPYNFICQIRLEDIAGFESAALLPSRGLIYFFAKVDYFLGGNTSHFLGQSLWNDNDVKVIYIEDIDIGAFEQKVIEADDDHVVPMARAVEFYREEGNKALSGHQLFGKPYCYPYETWDSPCSRWKLLLQVDSDEGSDYSMQFMDMGLLYFIISPNDLKKRDFTKVRATISSM